MRHSKTKKEVKEKEQRAANFRKRFQRTEAQYLEYLAKVSDEAANSTSEELNKLFTDQAKRIRKQIQELKK